MMLRIAILLAGCLWLAGCVSQTGCQGEACERAESQPGRLVIWWAPGLRGGLGNAEKTSDHSLVAVGE